MASYEVEIKLKLTDSFKRRLMLFLNKYSYMSPTEEKITDIYYNHPCRDFQETDEALRLRVVDNVGTLTYKGPRIDSSSKVREEIEVQNVDYSKFHSILIKLGFSQVIKITKLRKIYEIKGIRISIDYVNDLGTYVEFEKTCKEITDIPKVQKKLFQFIRNNIDPNFEKYIEPKTYLELILERKKNV
ncbi:MAG: class IV adenylate cyclase [Candidatus Asgardarchaeia archaeon]